MSTIAIHPVLADRFIRHESLVTNLALIGAGAALVGLLAQVSVPLWPVPITGQTLGVMLVGATLGARRGASAMVTYLILGVAGVPWFAEMTGGLGAVLKPSFGYIIGFIPAAFVIGFLSQKKWDRSPVLSVGAFGIASIIPFVFGIPYLWTILYLAGTTLGFAATMHAGFTPFIVGGIVKWLIGAALLPAMWTIVHTIDKSHQN